MIIPGIVAVSGKETASESNLTLESEGTLTVGFYGLDFDGSVVVGMRLLRQLVTFNFTDWATDDYSTGVSYTTLTQTMPGSGSNFYRGITVNPSTDLAYGLRNDDVYYAKNLYTSAIPQSQTITGDSRISKISRNGYWLFLLDILTAELMRYALTTPWDVTTVVSPPALTKTIADPYGVATELQSLEFSQSGLLMFIGATVQLADSTYDHVILEYALSSAFDITTASHQVTTNLGNSTAKGLVQILSSYAADYILVALQLGSNSYFRRYARI